MKIEKISENQIRCTLSRTDLEDRQIKLSELAYGSDKAKTLFQDMMREADMQFGFAADNMPLMIEAIPIAQGSIILNITKVEDPEELDTRFSKFSQSDLENIESIDDFSSYDSLPGTDEMINFLGKITKELAHHLPSESEKTEQVKEKKAKKTNNLLMAFSFKQIDSILDAAKIVAPMFQGSNTLYLDDSANTYYLILYQGKMNLSDFNRVCNTIAQFGKRETSVIATDCFYKEHFTVVMDSAIQRLSQ